MGQSSAVTQVIEMVAEATGRTDDEIRLALTVTAAAAGLVAALRVLKWLESLA